MERSAGYQAEKDRVQKLIETHKAQLPKLDLHTVNNLLALTNSSLTTEAEAVMWLERITKIIANYD